MAYVTAIYVYLILFFSLKEVPYLFSCVHISLYTQPPTRTSQEDLKEKKKNVYAWCLKSGTSPELWYWYKSRQW